MKSTLNYLKMALPFLLIFMGCQKLKPESVQIPEYPDFLALLNKQVAILTGSKIQKEVSLGDLTEVKDLEMDSIKWAQELSFLKEVNPNQPEYVGAFNKSEEGDLKVLTLKEGESGALKKVKYSVTESEYQSIYITLHEDKDVYMHHRDITMDFEKGRLSKMEIEGYQKMMFKDTVKFKVKVLL